MPPSGRVGPGRGPNVGTRVQLPRVAWPPIYWRRGASAVPQSQHASQHTSHNASAGSPPTLGRFSRAAEACPRRSFPPVRPRPHRDPDPGRRGSPPRRARRDRRPCHAVRGRADPARAQRGHPGCVRSGLAADGGRRDRARRDSGGALGPSADAPDPGRGRCQPALDLRPPEPGLARGGRRAGSRDREPAGRSDQPSRCGGGPGRRVPGGSDRRLPLQPRRGDPPGGPRRPGRVPGAPAAQRAGGQGPGRRRRGPAPSPEPAGGGDGAGPGGHGDRALRGRGRAAPG